MATKKLRELLTIDHRVSALQTCYNNAGRAFEGKKPEPSELTAYAFILYKAFIGQIMAGETRDAIQQITSGVSKVMSAKEARELMAKIKKSQKKSTPKKKTAKKKSKK